MTDDTLLSHTVHKQAENPHRIHPQVKFSNLIFHTPGVKKSISTTLKPHA